MLELYLISSIICTVLLLLMGKFIDGQVVFGDFIISILIGFTPIANLYALVCGVITILISAKFIDKKVF